MKVRAITPEQSATVGHLAYLIGERTRTHRASLGLHQDQYGERFGIKKERVSAIERARCRNVSIAVAIRLLDETGHTLAIVPKAVSV